MSSSQLQFQGVMKMGNKLDEKETRKRIRIRQLRKELPEPQKCSFCPNPLFDMMVSGDTEPYEIDGKPACKECYSRKLGEELENSPIGYVPKKIKVF